MNLRIRDRLRLALQMFRAKSLEEIGARMGPLLFPERRQPPRRGSQQILEAYREMPWLRALADRVATAVASTPWHLYAAPRGRTAAVRRNLQDANLAGPDERQRAIARMRRLQDLREILEHPWLNLIENPNPLLVGLKVRKLMSIYYDLSGEVALVYERDPLITGAQGLGVPFRLWPIPPTWVVEIPTPSKLFFKVRYLQHEQDIPASDMLWMVDPLPENPYGRSTGLARTLGDELETDEYAAKHAKTLFFNDARPPFFAWLKPDTAGNETTPEELERVKFKWLTEHAGVFKQWRPFFLNREIQIHEFNQDLRALEFNALRTQQRDIIREVWGVPPEVLGIIENSNRATIDAARVLMGLYVTMPRLEVQREEFQVRVLPEFDERLICDYESPVPEDREHALKVMMALPAALDLDEWREASGHEPLPDDAGKLHPVPLNLTLVPAEDLALPVEPIAPGDGEDGDVDVDDEDADTKAAWARPSPGRTLLGLRQRGGARPPRAGVVRAGGSEEDFYTLVHRIADRMEPRLRRAFLRAVREVRTTVNLAALEDALRAADISRILDVLPLDDLKAVLGNAEALPKLLRQTVAAAGEAAAREVGDLVGVALRFDLTNSAATIWAREHAATLVRQIDQETRQAIRDLVAQAFEQQITVPDLARMIRSHIGLRSDQVGTVLRFRERLVAGGRNAAEIARRVDRYADSLLRRRALTIARTETIEASSRGQQALWDQAVQDGVLEATAWRKIPIVTPDDRLDAKICEPMPYLAENQNVPIDGLLTTGDGRQKEGPTYHPNCRCAVGLERIE